MRCITAICPAGPPKESAAMRSQTRKASAKETPCPGLTGAVVIEALRLVASIEVTPPAAWAAGPGQNLDAGRLSGAPAESPGNLAYKPGTRLPVPPRCSEMARPNAVRLIRTKAGNVLGNGPLKLETEPMALVTAYLARTAQLSSARAVAAPIVAVINSFAAFIKVSGQAIT